MADGGFEMDDAAFDDALDDLADGAEEGPDAYEETRFIDPVPIDAERAEGRAGSTIASLQQAALQPAVDDYYDAVAKIGTSATRPRSHKFRACRW